MFLKIYPFLLGCLVCCHIADGSILLWFFNLCGVNYNFSSFLFCLFWPSFETTYFFFWDYIFLILLWGSGSCPFLCVLLSNSVKDLMSPKHVFPRKIHTTLKFTYNSVCSQNLLNCRLRTSVLKELFVLLWLFSCACCHCSFVQLNNNEFQCLWSRHCYKDKQWRWLRAFDLRVGGEGIFLQLSGGLLQSNKMQWRCGS